MLHRSSPADCSPESASCSASSSKEEEKSQKSRFSPDLMVFPTREQMLGGTSSCVHIAPLSLIQVQNTVTPTGSCALQDIPKLHTP